MLENALPLKEELKRVHATVIEDGLRLILPLPRFDDHAIAVLAMELRSLGFHFSDGPGWSPIDRVLHLRDRGFFTGPAPEIHWTAPDNCTTQADARR